MSPLSAAMRVAVIGGGAAGLCALRHLAAKPNLYKPICFELSNEIGGTWVYNEKTGHDENGQLIHSSMYKNLRTNLPKEVMAFPDYPFEASLPSFVTHQQVRDYLESYAKEFDIMKYVKLETSVERVNPVKLSNGTTEWNVQVCKAGQPSINHHEYSVDAVIVCNGHYSVPLLPDDVCLDLFEGLVLHSHNYRHAETFSERTVLCLGAGASGQDIALDIAKKAKQVYLAHRKNPLQSPLPSNVKQVRGLKEVKSKSVILEDGSELAVDSLLFCTGYKYTFPFLTPECNVKTFGERVTPLYKHLINTSHPSMCIIGVCKTICPFPQFDLQVRFFLSTLEGCTTLPSKLEMDADTQSDYDWRISQGMPHRHAHHMGPLQWGYNQEITDIANLKSIPRAVQNLYDHVHSIRRTNLTGYKKMNYRLLNDVEFEKSL